MTSPLPYDLCLKLRDAGWPQPEHLPDSPVNWVLPSGTNAHFLDPDGIYSPSLDELIKACERSHPYFRLMKAPGEKWCAGVMKDEFAHKWDYWTGATPQEAVAHLWLKLQEDKK